MPTLREQVEIDASPHHVWQVLADVTLLPELSSSTTEVRADGLLARVGQTFEQTVRLAGRSWTSTWQVDEIDPGQLLRIAGSLPGGTPYRMAQRLDGLGGGRSRLVIEASYELPMGSLGRLASRLGVERRARNELREVLEGVARMSAEIERGTPTSAGATP